MRALRFIFTYMLIFLITASASQAQPGLLTSAQTTVTTLAEAPLPARDRIALGAELLGIVAEPTPSAAPPLEVGTIQAFFVRDSSNNEVQTIDAELRAVGEHLAVWVEVGETNLLDESLQALVDAFDAHIYDQVRTIWGSEANPGIDGDPHIYALFVSGVNIPAIAYYFAEHSYPRSIAPYSNEHEMFIFNLNSLTGGFDLAHVEDVVAHEFQHMIRHNVLPNLDNWLDEGFSSFTQLLLYGNFSASLAFQEHPNTQLNAWEVDPAQRAPDYGASLLFTTYLYERYGLQALQMVSSSGQPRGLQAIDTTLRALGGPDVDTFFADWVLANELLDPTLTNGLYGYRLLPSGMLPPKPVATVEGYPFVNMGNLPQYATDYYALDQLGGLQTLDVRVDIAPTVPLVDTAPASGTRLWYSNRADDSVTTLTHTFDLRPVSSATLNYSLWYDLETDWDYGYVLVSDDGGTSWDRLATPGMTASDPFAVAYGTGYTGASPGWQHESLSLDRYVGQEIMLRFSVITDDAITRPGMALDDVSIPELGYATDFEGDAGGWVGDGWVWVENVLPQQMWVQAIQMTGAGPQINRWLATESSTWTLPLADDLQSVVIGLSPFAPVTLTPADYRLTISAG
ncbi:MAG: immune inhibitor A [Anaerolineae bacterium]|nr:immune inhibitor A [Anaerolineae bacterium]